MFPLLKCINFFLPSLTSLLKLSNGAETSKKGEKNKSLWQHKGKLPGALVPVL